jgi:hypothetical protein
MGHVQLYFAPAPGCVKHISYCKCFTKHAGIIDADKKIFFISNLHSQYSLKVLSLPFCYI